MCLSSWRMRSPPAAVSWCVPRPIVRFRWAATRASSCCTRTCVPCRCTGRNALPWVVVAQRPSGKRPWRCLSQRSRCRNRFSVAATIERRPLDLWCVRVAEINPPKGVTPVEWTLLTNQPVTTLGDAWERASWYEVRWVIEEYHKAMKTGCAIEEMQFTTAQALEPMIALLSVVAVTLLNLREAVRRPDAAERPATDWVDAEYVSVLSAWRHKEIRMDWTVHDFFYALARLGGHQNRKRDHRPGWLVLWRGWNALQHMIDGAAAAKLRFCG